MTIKEVFKTIRGGFNCNKKTPRPNEIMIVKTFQKDALQNSKFMDNRFIQVSLAYTLNNKYFLKEKDIVISLKKPYRAAALSKELTEKVLVPNNFIILRDISDEYDYLFVVNYLNIIGIDNLIDQSIYRSPNSDLTKEDIKSIELPNINISEQKKYINLLDSINERSIVYKKIQDNDERILEFIMKSIVGDK